MSVIITSTHDIRPQWMQEVRFLYADGTDKTNLYLAFSNSDETASIRLLVHGKVDNVSDNVQPLLDDKSSFYELLNRVRELEAHRSGAKVKLKYHRFAESEFETRLIAQDVWPDPADQKAVEGERDLYAHLYTRKRLFTEITIPEIDRGRLIIGLSYDGRADVCGGEPVFYSIAGHAVIENIVESLRYLEDDARVDKNVLAEFKDRFNKTAKPTDVKSVQHDLVLVTDPSALFKQGSGASMQHGFYQIRWPGTDRLAEARYFTLGDNGLRSVVEGSLREFSS